jgi:hypothetical protein
MLTFYWDIAADLPREIRLPHVITVVYGRTIVAFQLPCQSVFT